VCELGKPLIVEEMFPFRYKVEELDAFIEGAGGFADGWFGFLLREFAIGIRDREFSTHETSMGDAITKEALKYFRDKAKIMSRDE
jgi:hypothetical protein